MSSSPAESVANSAAAKSAAALRSFPDWFTQLVWEPVSRDDYKQLDAFAQLARIRHSAAHLLAHALQDWEPEVQFAIGPATAQGFFYDVKAPQPIREEVLPQLQARMEQLANQSLPFETATVTKAQAMELFGGWGQPHKVDILGRIPSETVTLYRTGDFIDLCAGPHVPHSGLCRNVQLLTVAGAHWWGEETPSLTRVGGTAWATPKDLQRYLEFLEESKKRDHRVLGPQLNLFGFHPWGMGTFWQPKGLTWRRLLEAYWRETLERYGYEEILNPILYRKELFETSGHWDHFRQNMFVFEESEPDACGNHAALAIKPMNCPDTMLYFRSQTRSYRDLPMRVAEGQILHRNEATGAMHGLMRTRMFCQDDAHIFLTEDQVASEVASLFQMLDEVYALFQLDYTFSLSTRPENFMGDMAVWDKAEAALRTALEQTGRSYAVEEGEGAFYGPKIDVQIRDSLGRQWQCGTFQLDFQLPERFELNYVAQDGSYKRPIVIHRAIFGSFERFMGILLEHVGGAFPTWLAPVQAVVLPIAERHLDYAKAVQAQLRQQGFRVEVNGEDSVNYRIRQAETGKIPYMLVVGDREAEEQSVAVRQYKVKERRTLSLEALVAELRQKVTDRTFDVVLTRYADLFWNPSAAVSTESEAY